ncbi:MAG: hypothetical protein IJ428_05095 [Clostridia bacterium]|nr:hypothetical protein [Clostridia bacterium]
MAFFICAAGTTSLPRQAAQMTDSFKKLDEWQWISKIEAVPDEIICISVKDYLHTVTFSEKAKEIQKILFG